MLIVLGLSTSFVMAPAVVEGTLFLGIIIHPGGHSDSDLTLLLVCKLEIRYPIRDAI